MQSIVAAHRLYETMHLGDPSVLYRSTKLCVDNHDQYRAGRHLSPPSQLAALLAVVKTVVYTDVYSTSASTRN
jgi:hypothetical protein